MATERRPPQDDAGLRLDFADRLHARLAGFGGGASGVVTSPEPLWTGDSTAARRLAGGLLMLGGAVVEADGRNPWDIHPPSAAWAEALHGFDWLDDAVVADPASRATLMGWLHDWVEHFGAGVGAGWRADLTGRRLARWICHAPEILNGATPEQSRAFFRAIGRQTTFLRRRWRSAPEGLPRFHAAAGLIYAGLAVEGAGDVAKEGIAALAREGDRRIGIDGGVPSRRPEEMAEIFALLVWAERTLEEAGLSAAPDHRAAINRMAPGLRALRLGDGGLARFHGGGAGDAERIDRALTASGRRAGDRRNEVMRFHRLTNGRSTVILDAGPPGAGATADGPHASALCIEMSVGRQRLIVNCGPGGGFGEHWRLAARATAAHSGLTVDDLSCVRVREPGEPESRTGALDIRSDREEDAAGVRVTAGHGGYLASHGLIHRRQLSLSADGRDLRGEDKLNVGEGRAAFDAAASGGGVPFAIRFHLHPDVDAELFLKGGAARLRLPDGDVWVMRQLGGELAIEDSVYLDDRRVRPRATKQIVVKAAATEYAGVVKWAFTRTEPEKAEPGGRAGDAVEA